MANYYIDTEFLEGTQKTFFGKSKPTIDLISIGLVSEDGREYCAVSKEFNLKEAWNRFQLEQQSGDMRNVYPEGKKVYWLRDNVLLPIFKEWQSVSELNSMYDFTYNNFKGFLSCYGKTNKQIAEEIVQFVDARWIDENRPEKGFIYPVGTSLKQVKTTDIQFYGYYADYDWVVFCWLFGSMMQLPNGFPMYCNDLKQILDEKAKSRMVADQTFEDQLRTLKEFAPKQENEHNALADAKWNKKLHEFLNSL